MSTAGTGLKLGTTLFSLTNEFLSLQYDFEQLVAKVGELELGPGLEVVGFQSVRGFPHVSDEFAARFRELLARHQLVPTCLGINADVAIRRGTTMSTEQSVAYHAAQIEAAAKLGFPVARYQFAAGPEVIRRLAPLAEKLQVKLGLEVHAPHSVDSPLLMAYREMYQREASPYLGFIPDFGSCARTVPPAYLASLRDRGVPQPMIDMALDAWRGDGDANERRAEFQKRAVAGGATPETISALSVIFNILSPQSPKAWLAIMPQVVHIHGKFYDFDSQGNETAIPYEEILPVFLAGGYNGYMSSEWEGHMYSEASGFAMIEKHHALCRRVLEQRH